MVRTSLDTAQVQERLTRLSVVDEHMESRYPGAGSTRQPVHTCYVSAGDVNDATIQRWDQEALAAFDEHAAHSQDLVEILGMEPQHAEAVHSRVRAKLFDDPVEDL